MFLILNINPRKYQMPNSEILQKKLHQDSIVKVGGAFDAMSAKLVENSGFDAASKNSDIVRMLASGNACTAEIAKLPAQTASNPLLSTSLADIESNAPPTLIMEFPSNFFRKISLIDI